MTNLDNKKPVNMGLTDRNNTNQALINNIIPYNQVVINNLERLFLDNRVFKCDIEILNDYFSFQFKRYHVKSVDISNKYPNIKLVDDVYIFECFNDDDIYNFAEFYTNNIMKFDSKGNINTFLYFWNASFDKTIISMLINLVNAKKLNIIKKLRKVSEYLIVKKINYRNILDKHWKVIFDNNINNDNKIKEVIKLLDNENEIAFYNEFNQYLKNKAEKKEISKKNTDVIKILDIPTCGGSQLLQGSGKNIYPIGLKTLQLVELGHQEKFDFNQYTSIEVIKANNLYDVWLSYCAYDVNSEEIIFDKFVKQTIINRYYALIECMKIKDIEFKSDVIFNQSNTDIINHLFNIGDKKVNIDVDFESLIETTVPQLKNIIKHTNENKHIDKDSELKTFKVFKENSNFIINGCKVDIGYGGIHGVINNYIYKDDNLYDLDFASLYPNIVIHFKELFKNVMDVDLYQTVLQLRLDYKKKSKDNQYSKSEQSEFKAIQEGLKLLINSSYGLVNKPYDDKKGISHKNLGRLICLYGQKLALDMVLYNQEVKPININTDGIFFVVPDHIDVNKIVNDLSIQTGITLEADKFITIIQDNVNNYIAIDSKGNYKLKGKYNINFKRQINKLDSVIDVNILNAYKLMKNEEIEISHIYFDTKITNLKNCKYYFTSKDKGISLIKHTSKPVNYLIDSEIVYITDDINNAELEIYIKYAKSTLDKIYNFNTSIETSKYFEHEIIEDLKENNKLKSENIKRIAQLLQIDKNDIGLNGFMGNIKASTYKNGVPNKNVINYSKTALLKSTDVKGLSVEPKEKLIVIDLDLLDKSNDEIKNDVDISLINELKAIKTYITSNTKTDKYNNCKLIFKNDINKILKVNDKYKNYIEVLTKSAVVWSLDDDVRKYYDNNLEATNVSNHIELINKITDVKHEDAKKHIEEIKTKEIKTFTDKKYQDKLIQSIVEVLNDFDIDVFEVNNNIAVSCPYCSHFKTNHYKGNKKIDGYININPSDNKNGFVININNLSASCKNDVEHEKFYKVLIKEIYKKAPTKKLIEINKLVKEIKENINKEKLISLDEKKLVANTLMVIGTGGHKTFQSARKLVENVFINGIFHIHSAKENQHIEDFETEIKKVLSIVLDSRTKLIDDFLDNETMGLERIGIHKLTSITPIKTIESLNGIVTNHSYFYNLGHLSIKNKNMEQIIEYVKSNNINHELVIDEFESFEDKGLIQIQLNGFQYYDLDYDNKNRHIEIIAPTCLYEAVKPVMRKMDKPDIYKFATEFSSHDFVEYEGIKTYSLMLGGEKKLSKVFYQNVVKSNNKHENDFGRRVPQKVDKNNENFVYIDVDQIIEYDRISTPINFNSDNENDFIKLIHSAKGLVIIRKVLKVGKANDDIENFETIDNLDDLREYGKELEKNNISFDKFKDRLSIIGKELFIDYLIIHTQNVLNEFKGTKYYVSANSINVDNIPINNTLEFISSKNLKNIDVCVFDRSKSNDDYIIKSLGLLKDKNFFTLAFTAQAKYCNPELIKAYKYKHVLVKQTLNIESGKSKTITVDSRNTENINNDLKRNVTLSYLNGTESQGRNYSQPELLIVNAKAEINVKGRTEIKNGKINVLSIEEATIKKLKQTIGRIFRGEVSYKAIILLGEYGSVINLFKSYPDNFTINFNIEKYTKKIDTKELFNKAIADVINYYESKMNNYNGETIKHFNDDNRLKDNEIELEIYNYYVERVKNYYETNHKKLKDIEIIPEITTKFNISQRTFKTIKSKYKNAESE